MGVLRDRLGVTSVKDGCSPQGQCGCCTVLVDGAPRVACVTPARRIRDRSVTTVGGLDAGERQRWGEAFVATGASQCGFCTPGIICRLVGHERRGADLTDRDVVCGALAAHLCRCTGWQTIVEAAGVAVGDPRSIESRDVGRMNQRAALETEGPQRIGVDVALGAAVFSDDTAPGDALVAIPGPMGWVVGETLAAARARAGKVQGRRTTLSSRPPIDLPEGDWDVTLQTSWTEPAYLETDAAWCTPGGDPSDPLGNGGAFGGKLRSPVRDAARQLADEHGRPVRVRWSREDVVRQGPKRPPMAVGMSADGRGVVRVARTPGIAALISSRLPDCRIEEVDLPGPPTSSELRGAGWVEAEMLRAALAGGADWIVSPSGGRARARVDAEGIVLEIDGGDPLDEVLVRTYAIGAAHMAWSWVNGEALTVDEAGQVHDLTIRSFGITGAAAMVPVEVTITGDRTSSPTPIGDAAFAAVAAAAWLFLGQPSTLPTS